MADRRDDAQDGDQGPNLGPATGAGRGHPNARPLDHLPIEADTSQQSDHVDEPQRLREAQSAFSANADITATTPRQTAWTGGTHLPAAATRPQGDAQIPPTADPFQHEIPNTSTPHNAPARGNDQDWAPRLALGSINADKLGAREAARRHMLQWDRIHAYNAVHHPDSLQTVERHRTEARRVYEALAASDLDEDVLPRDALPDYQSERIQARTALLWEALRDAPEDGCEPMKENITAALRGYNTGAIGFSACYTLIYAGQIVDATARSYAEFTVDRQERLDRYFELHGPGYLWWEPPLAGGRERVLAKKGVCLTVDREEEVPYTGNPRMGTFQDDAAHYKVPMGFRRDDTIGRRLKRSTRRRSVVAKDAQSETLAGAKRKKAEMDRVVDEPERGKRQRSATPGAGSSSHKIGGKGLAVSVPSVPGHSTRARAGDTQDSESTGAPVMFFDMLLDSGAELPILLHDDFDLLGYTRDDMNAASVVELSAAAGQSSTALCFELRAGLELEDSTGDESETDRVAHAEHNFFPCRVIKLPPAVKTPAYGAFSADRLSGMLPFLAYYMASAPGNRQMMLGVKRAEVLSNHNLPAGLKYDPYNNPNTSDRAQRREEVSKIAQLGGQTRWLRKVTFETEMENGTTLVDEDTISRREEEVTSSIKVVNKFGRLVGGWHQGSMLPPARP